MTQSKRTLEVRHLGKQFAGLKAVDDVNLDLRNGEILGLIGPNGSGKTTFVNLVTGLLEKTTGTVVIDGHDVSKYPAYKVARAGLARTFQAIRLFKDLTVLENVEVAAVSQGLSRPKAAIIAKEKLEEVGLSAFQSKLSGSLTFGDQRRLELARALAMNPKFLLLDEPAAGLNEDESDALLDLLRPMPKLKDIGILIIDHDMRLMMNLCNRLHVLNFGQTIAEGTPDEIKSNPHVIEAYLGSAAQ